jgi:hypothetical protein
MNQQHCALTTAPVHKLLELQTTMLAYTLPPENLQTRPIVWSGYHAGLIKIGTPFVIVSKHKIPPKSIYTVDEKFMIPFFRADTTCYILFCCSPTDGLFFFIIPENYIATVFVT